VTLGSFRRLTMLKMGTRYTGVMKISTIRNNSGDHRAPGLRGQSISAFAKVPLQYAAIGKTENSCGEEVLNPVETGLQWLEPRESLGQVPHRRGPSGL
jgi:hypothetical protein